MAERELLKVGNNIVEAEPRDEFADGYTNGSLYCYDMNHQLARPLTTTYAFHFHSRKPLRPTDDSSVECRH